MKAEKKRPCRIPRLEFQNTSSPPPSVTLSPGTILSLFVGLLDETQSFVVDRQVNPADDLCEDEVWLRLEARIRMGDFGALVATPPSSSFACQLRCRLHLSPTAHGPAHSIEDARTPGYSTRCSSS